MKKKPNVLVANKEAIVALDLHNMLSKWGFNIEETFRTGEGLLKFAQEDDPDILIMDTFLAGKLDAFETAREVLKTNKIPVIFMTGSAHSEYAKDVDIGGKYVYLHKPFSEDALREAIMEVYPEFNGRHVL
jgi:CheY-like chemotaxis protein